MATIESIRRGIIPRATPEQVRDLLWCCTPYPFCKDLRKLRRCLRRSLRGGGGTILGAIEHAHRELDAAMENNKREVERLQSSYDQLYVHAESSKGE